MWIGIRILASLSCWTVYRKQATKFYVLTYNPKRFVLYREKEFVTIIRAYVDVTHK